MNNNNYKLMIAEGARKRYDDLIECILSDQVSAEQIQQHFTDDPIFEYYYKSKRRLLEEDRNGLPFPKVG
mgnify:CR=1 FL=1